MFVAGWDAARKVMRIRTWSTSLLTVRGAGYLSSSRYFLKTMTHQVIQRLQIGQKKEAHFIAVIIGGGPVQNGDKMSAMTLPS